MKTLLLTFFILFSTASFAESFAEFQDRKAMELKAEENEKIIKGPDFIRAIEKNNLQKVQDALEAGLDPNLPARIYYSWFSRMFKSPESETKYPLVVAVSNSLPEMTSLLISYRANPDAYRTHDTPLDIAIEKGCLKCAKHLIEAGADISGFKGGHYMRKALSSERWKFIDYFESLGLEMTDYGDN